MGMKEKTFDSAATIVKAVFSPYILSGFIAYASSTVLWLYILSKMPLSRAYPIQALAYPTVLILSSVLFNESISVTRWVGVCIIILGIVIVVQ
jgi:drug/metabolite transporter (DMT)-like permease